MRRCLLGDVAVCRSGLRTRGPARRSSRGERRRIHTLTPGPQRQSETRRPSNRRPVHREYRARSTAVSHGGAAGSNAIGCPRRLKTGGGRVPRRAPWRACPCRPSAVRPRRFYCRTPRKSGMLRERLPPESVRADNPHRTVAPRRAKRGHEQALLSARGFRPGQGDLGW